MKTITLWGLAGIAFLSLSQPTWAGPRVGGGSFAGGGHVSGGGRVGGFSGGGSRAAPAFHSPGVQGAPALRSDGAYFTGRAIGTATATPRFYYGGGNRITSVRPHAFTGSAGRYTNQYAGRAPAANRQPTRVGSIATPTNRQATRVGSTAPAARPQSSRVRPTTERNRVSNPRTPTTANRQSFVKNHASERHDGNNWHRDWDRHHAHFHHNRVFVFVDGFWWGLDPGYYPWNYYPDYDYDYGNYPYNSYYGNPYDYYNYSPYSDDDPSDYSDSSQSTGNATVSAAQAELAKLGYYNGAIDGTLGYQTEAAIARYQEDQDLSVTGRVDAATLHSLGIR